MSRLISFICVFVIMFSVSLPVTRAEEIYANAFAYTLNDAIGQYGVVLTDTCGGYINVSPDTGEYPSGVIYADLVKFKNDDTECLVIFRSDSMRGCISVDIYSYNEETKKAELITTLSKDCKISSGRIGELALGYNDSERYIVCNEYADDERISAEYYTVIDGDAFLRVEEPDDTKLTGVVTFNGEYLHPEVDVSYYNKHLDAFFSKLKDYASLNVRAENILDDVTKAELEQISKVLKKTAGFDSFDIGKYDTMAEYALEVKKHDGDGQFNAITHIYDLGDGMYYVRYSTDLCFYNGTILRRTDALADKYQILCVRNDFIPFSDAELSSLKSAYMKNKLVLQKSMGKMESEDKPLIKINKIETEKKVDVPQVLPQDIKLPAVLIGGGVIAVLLIALWIYLSSDEK